MNAIILSVGDELVLGQTVDTNSAWISQHLAAAGCAVAAHLTVPDNQRAIEQAMEESVGRCDVLIISGGIGPTEDDLTRQALSDVLRQPLELNEAWLKELEAFFTQRGRPMPVTNRIQAMIPHGCRMIHNSCGTAAGIEATYRSGDQKTICRIFVMPGVPKEMKAMFLNDVLPFMKQASGGAVIASRTLHTFGLGESAVAEKLGDLMKRDRNPSVGTTVSGGVVSLRVNSYGESGDKALTELENTVRACYERLGSIIYDVEDRTLAQSVADLLLSPKGDRKSPWTVATAESCTGGLLAKYLTDIRGSSKYLMAGWITYSNESKSRELGVARELIEHQGAVSEEVVRAMSAGVKKRAGTDFAFSISGVAGPDGGTAAKPVGMVCIALAHADGITVRTFNFPGDREMIRDRSAKMALSMLRYQLLGERMPF